jgi:6-pyruvoyl-tetrahydropterin synthase
VRFARGLAGTTYRTIERKLKARVLVDAVPQSPSPIRDEFKVVRDTDAIIISDIEVPDYSQFMFKATLLTAMRYNIKRVIWAGDLVATDQDALNSWMTVWRDEGQRTYIADIKELKKIVRVYGEWFDHQYAIEGNHDMRLARKTGGEVTIDDLLEDVNLELGHYSYMYVFNPELKEWTFVCHQFNYSKTSVKLAQDIWAVTTAPDGYDNTTGSRIPDYDPLVHGWNTQKCHVVITHTHVAQEGVSPDDSWACIGMGCMRDQRRTKYTQARATKFPKWNNAFVMMKNGKFTTMSMKRTDWRSALGEL